MPASAWTTRTFGLSNSWSNGEVLEDPVNLNSPRKNMSCEDLWTKLTETQKNADGAAWHGQRVAKGHETSSSGFRLWELRFHGVPKSPKLALWKFATP